MVRNVSDFKIFLDTDNELAFSLEIDGAEDSSVRSQFVIEGPRGINLSFAGESSAGEVIVGVPSLTGIVREGVYDTRLEVIVDDRLFVPLEMRTSIRPSVKVEAAVRTSTKSNRPVVTASVTNKTKGARVLENKKSNPPVKKQTLPKQAGPAVPALDELLRELETIS